MTTKKQAAAVLEPPVAEEVIPVTQGTIPPPPTPPAPPAAGTPDPDGNDKAFIEWATPGTLTARGYVAPLSDFLIWVDCDLFPEVKDFRVGIRLGIAYRAIQRKEQAPGKNDYERALRTIALVAPQFENWPAILDPFTQTPIPEPDSADYTTYSSIGWWTGACPALGQWLLTDGYNAAYKKATAKN